MTLAPKAPEKQHERAVFWLMLYPLLLPVIWTISLLAMNRNVFFSPADWLDHFTFFSLFILLGIVYLVPLYPVWLILLYIGFSRLGRATLSNAGPHAVRDLIVSNIAFTLLVVLPPILYYFQIIPYVGP